MIVAPGTRIFRQKFLNFQELKIYSLGCHLYTFVDNLGSLFVLTFVHCTVFLYFFMDAKNIVYKCVNNVYW